MALLQGTSESVPGSVSKPCSYARQSVVFRRLATAATYKNRVSGQNLALQNGDTSDRGRATQASEVAKSACRASNRAVSMLMGGFELVAKRKLVTHNTRQSLLSWPEI